MSEKKHKHKTSALIDYSLELGMAVTYTETWREEATVLSPDGDFKIKAWRLPMEEFVELVDNLRGNDARGLRFYIGIDPGNTDPNARYRLMVVGVNEEGNDVINYDDPMFPGIYDFSQPCPPTCDTSSLLSGPPIQNDHHHHEK